MADENGNLDPTNEELDEQVELVDAYDLEEEDAGVLKEKLALVAEQNKQLFARAKKAEGFTKGDDGKWVKKPAEHRPEPKLEVKPKDSPDIDKLLDEKLEKRELEALDLSDDLKKEVSVYAKVNGVSIRKALTSDYIQFKKNKDEDRAKAEEASLGGGRRTTAKKDISQIDPNSLDLTTEEGRKEKAAWDAHIAKQLG